MRTPDERALLQELRLRSFRRGEFKLASGLASDYYIDARMTTVSPCGAYLVGEVIYGRVAAAYNPHAIGGLQVGAVPLVTAAVIAYHRHNLTALQRRERECGPVEGFWVRDAAKGHGTGKAIEGRLAPGNSVIIVDDVCTTGDSALRAVEAVEAHGCVVELVLALVDRLQGARKLFDGRKIHFESVFTVRDFGVA